MRKRIDLLIILPALLIFLSSNLNAQTYNGDLTLTSQAQVDAFNYTSVTGNLTIQESVAGNITNLNGLSELVSVGGYLLIFNNSALGNIAGLSNLSSIGGYLELKDNSSLVNISGLNGLTSIGGLFEINKNAALTDVEGLNNLTSIGGTLFIAYNDHLVNISGLNNVTTIGGSKLQISNNIILANISGLNGLTSIGEFNISDNDGLAHIDGFNSLALMTGNFEMFNMPLIDIKGFTKLATIGGYLNLKDNSSLVDISGLNGLTSIGGLFQINKNEALASIAGLNNLTSIGGSLFIGNNDHLVNLSGLNGVASIGGNLLRINNNSILANISGLNGLTSIGVFDISNNDGLAHIDGFNSLSSITGNFELFNSLLIDIKGLTNLTTIGGYLNLKDNSFLVDISGLNDLTTIGGLFQISNTAITHIDGLNNLTSIGGNLFIVYNDHLVNISGLNGLATIGESQLHISSNSILANISGLNGLTSIGVFDIGDNAFAHIDGFNSLGSINGGLGFQNDNMVDIHGFNSLTSISGGLMFASEDELVDINGFTKLKSIGGSLIISEDHLLSDISVLSNLETVGQNLKLFENTALHSMGLNKLSSIGGYLIIEAEPFAHFDGFNSLTSIGGDLTIETNGLLPDLDGLNNLRAVGGNLIIKFNVKLNNFCGLLTLFKNNGLAGSYSVFDNAVNPTKQELIDASNQGPVISDVTANPATLAPPNHKMKDVTVNYTSTDNCGVESCLLTVTSNESINGTGDGDTSPDWEITDDHHVKLRAERAANGSGRIYTITVTCIDHQGNASTKTVEVRVAHNITGPVTGKPFKVGSTVDFAGEFWDKPTNKHTAKWLIDDNTTVKGVVTEPTSTKNGKVTGSYKFTSPGVYKLQMNTIDQNNVTTYANTNGDVEEIIVIYDPNGGYAYGGGYFDSPAGALKSNPTATGKVSYGFAMNYFKNATLPKGETQFEFKIGDFEYNAVNFDYLSISGAKAQFKGTGKIVGGQSGINFIMTVIDGDLDGTGIDKVRMKIYNKNTGQIYYDNQPGASDAANPIAAVGLNSSIVVQNTAITSTQKEMITEEVRQDVKELEVKAMPNPSNNNFTLKVRSNNLKDKIVMQVIDMYGRVIEIRNVAAEQTIKLGDKYKAGTYIVRLLQGEKQKELKLIKL